MYKLHTRKQELYFNEVIRLNQCDQLEICWVACRDDNGYKRFKLALEKFEIPYADYTGNLDEDLPAILDEIM